MTSTSKTMRWALALALVMLTITLHVDDAFARAGSGGSRGSRSYSAPARPTSPANPASPSRLSNPPASQPMQAAPARGGWFGGGLMGGLAGFALGGLLGSMLFGGHGFGGGGGFGLMDMLLIGGALFLLYRLFMARRTPQPAYATAGGYGGAQVADVGYSSASTATATEAAPAGPSELDRGLTHIRQMDPGFDPSALASTARSLFTDVQRSVTARDMSAVSAQLTPRMYNELTAQCDRLRAARRTNQLEQVDVRRAEATEAWQESGQDYVTIYLAGSVADYTVDDTSGAVVEGNRASQDFEEYWTFARPVGPNRWKLSAIQTA
jgi:predicted lipid-binding transport protein (Tim44 family)